MSLMGVENGTFIHGPAVASIMADGEVIYHPEKKKRAHRGSEGMVYLVIELNAAADIMPLLTPTQHKIIALILSDYRDDAPWARMTAREIAQQIGVTEKYLYRALTPLRRANLVLKHSQTMWQVSPHYGWRGSRKNWKLAMAEAPAIDLEALR